MAEHSKPEPYRPSNGSIEGAAFMARWCDRCEREAGYRRDPNKHDACRILVNTMAYSIGDPEYPREWVRDENGPRCTAFVSAGARHGT